MPNKENSTSEASSTKYYIDYIVEISRSHHTKYEQKKQYYVIFRFHKCKPNQINHHALCSNREHEPKLKWCQTS